MGARIAMGARLSTLEIAIMLMTTLNEIRQCKPCAIGWNRLLNYFNKTASDGELFPFVQILKSNGLTDAIWCLRANKDTVQIAVKFSLWCTDTAANIKGKTHPDVLNAYNAFAVVTKYQDDQKFYDEVATQARYAAYSAENVGVRVSELRQKLIELLTDSQ